MGVKIICLLCYSKAPVQNQLDISEENVPYSSPSDDQRVYDFAQDRTSDPNLYAVVHKHTLQAPIEPDQSKKYQASDEMPTSSVADSTQHYAVLNNYTNKGNAPVYDDLNRRF